MPSAFEILGLERSATVAQIKTRFRALCNSTHPDHGGSAALFRMVNDAYREALASAGSVSRASLGWEVPATYFAR